MTYKYLGSLEESVPPANSDVSNINDWQLINNEIYSRDVSGREIAIYKNNELEEYPLYGLDMIGRLVKDAPQYYYKDHLGSVRAVVNSDNEVLSAQDYACPPWRDAWGYLLEGRQYESDSSKFKFTGKERDEESEYDYFGARYYDARVGRWGSVDPYFEKHLDFTPYNYVLDNPLIYYDPDGRDPYRKYLGSKEQVMKIIEQNKGKTYFELSNVFKGSSVRYIYTEKGGFIDLRHFFTAASVSNNFSIQDAIIYGEGMEHVQFMFGKESANDPEDRPSNLEGARFGNNTVESDAYTNFSNYLDEQKIVDPSDPNISTEKIYIPYDENDTPLPDRASYKPYRGEPLKNDDIKGIGKY